VSSGRCEQAALIETGLGSIRSLLQVDVAVSWGGDPLVEVDGERPQRLFLPGATDSGIGAAELLHVPDREVEDFEGGQLGGELAAVAG